jgi:histidyl-tRNA synthetase
MTHKLQPVRGTKDLLEEEHRLFSHVTATSRQVSGLYGFSEIATPIFEFTEIFKKTLGEESDVVGKEMYTFEDRGGESMTLRPEFTAGVARAFISGGLQDKLPLKWFSVGPIFRYERPQKGRQRQFHQVNFELLGVAEPMADVETISMGAHILRELGVLDKVQLEINSLGDKESRDNYRKALIEYFTGFKAQLSDDSKIRLEKNPMRILDSKDEGDKKIVAGAPVMSDYYSPAAANFFAAVLEGLDSLGVAYVINKHLVRGLDYYCHTAFEFTTDALGAQNTVMAGGRYDGLIGMMGGVETPAVGFAAGVERLMALIDTKISARRPVVIIPIGERAEKEAVVLAGVLRAENLYIELGYNGNVKKRMKKANGMNAVVGIIFGDEELDAGVVKLKDFDSGEEVAVKAAELSDKLGGYRKG